MLDYMHTPRGTMSVPIPRPEDIHLEDIARALSLTVRWRGFSKKGSVGEGLVINVAAHSIGVADALEPKHRIHGLLHDAAEAYISDIPTPWKQRAPELGLMELDVLFVIYDALGVPQPDEEAVTAVHLADSLVGERERRVLFEDSADIGARAYIRYCGEYSFYSPCEWHRQYVDAVKQELKQC